MSETKEKKVEVSDLQRSWSNATLPAMNLTPRTPRRRDSLVRQPPPVRRQPALADKINKQLMTYDQLVERIGHQPHDDKLGGIWKMSKNYKKMRTEIGAVKSETDKSLAAFDPAALEKSLKSLEQAGKDYGKQHKSDDTRSATGGDVSGGAADRLKQLKAVMEDPDLDKVKDHITVEQALDCKARGIRFKDCDFGTLNDDQLGSVDEKFGAGAANSVSLITFKDASFRVFKAEQASDPNPLDGLERIGIDPASPHNGNRNIATSVMSDVLGVSVIARSSFGMHKNPVSQKVEIGLMMEKATGVTPAQTTYTPFKKPASGRNAEMMEKYAKDPSDEEAAALLKKLDIRQRANFKEGTTPEDQRWEKGTKGLKRSWPPPLSAKAKAAMQEQLVGLDWCDALTGQTDRHAFNYFIKVDGDKVTVTGIDNDMAFGEKQGQASVSVKEVDARKTPPGLPQLIDTKVLAELKRKTFARDVLPGLDGLLNEKELEATRSRFEQTQAHALDLERNGFVVTDWTTWRHPDDTGKDPAVQRTAAQFLADCSAAKDKDGKVSGGLFGRDFAAMLKDEGPL